MFHVVPYRGNFIRQVRSPKSSFCSFRFTVTVMMVLFVASFCAGCVHLKPVATSPASQDPPIIQETVEQEPVPVQKEIEPEENVSVKEELKEQEQTQTQEQEQEQEQRPCNLEKKRAMKAAFFTPMKTMGTRLVIGEVEPVTIGEAGITLSARIDTGAQTSSMGATDITPYERDGEKWVRFTIASADPEKPKSIEKPISRTVRIKRHGGISLSRYTVNLRVALGKMEKIREFTLVDRAAFKYPVIIGRNFLDGTFIVDVGLKNSTSPFSDSSGDEK